MYKCEILADSLSPQRDRLTTFKVTYPRIIHAELMTHRVFSRNAASSRAIPVKKMIEYVRDNMFTPLAIQKAHKGMQGSDYFEGVELEQAKQLWIESAELALQQAEKMEKFGITKQLINRILEPYQYYQVLVTATEFDNFFELRCPQYNIGDGSLYKSKKDAIKYIQSKGIDTEIGELFILKELDWIKSSESQAEIHIQKIAEMMWDCYNESTPKQLEAGEWHIPFGDNMDINLLKDEIVKHWDRTDKNRVLAYASKHEYVREEEIKYYQIRQKIATARCARISYETLGDNPKIDYEADIKLHDRLLLNKHLSCFEHCARAMSNDEYETFVKGRIVRVGCEIERYDKGDYSEDVVIKKDIQGWCNNFKGFINYRYLIEDEKNN